MPLLSCSDIESLLRTLSARRDVKQDEALRQIKPVWIRNPGDAQQDDGGWSPFAALVPVGGRPLFWLRAEIFYHQAAELIFSYDGFQATR